MNEGTISAEIVGTSTSSTRWPRLSRAPATARAPATQAGSVGMPSGAWAISPIRNPDGVDPSSWLYGRAGAGALYQASGSGREIASSTAAESATVCDTTPSTTAPCQLWARRGTRPRLGLSPTRPQYDAGIRIEPPPSLACAIGNMPPATAAPAPPLDPPGDLLGSHGLRLIPWRRFSATVITPKAGVLVRPHRTKPARTSASTTSSLRSLGPSGAPCEP